MIEALLVEIRNFRFGSARFSRDQTDLVQRKGSSPKIGFLLPRKPAVANKCDESRILLLLHLARPSVPISNAANIDPQSTREKYVRQAFRVDKKGTRAMI